MNYYIDDFATLLQFCKKYNLIYNNVNFKPDDE